MSVRAVVRDAWALYRAAFGRYVAIAAAAFVVLHLVVVAQEAWLPDEEGATLVFAAVLAAVAVLGSLVVYAALVHGGGDEERTAAAVGGAYRATAGRLGTVLAAAVVQSVGIAVGLLLLVVPGVYLATRWSLVFQAIVLEGAGWRRAFSRSAELVRGRFAPMLGVVLLTFAASAVALLVPAAAERWLPLPEALSGWVVGVAADSLAFPYFALLFNAAHARLVTPPSAAGPTPAAATA